MNKLTWQFEDSGYWWGTLLRWNTWPSMFYPNSLSPLMKQISNSANGEMWNVDCLCLKTDDSFNLSAGSIRALWQCFSSCDKASDPSYLLYHLIPLKTSTFSHSPSLILLTNLAAFHFLPSSSSFDSTSSPLLPFLLGWSGEDTLNQIWGLCKNWIINMDDLWNARHTTHTHTWTHTHQSSAAKYLPAEWTNKNSLPMHTCSFFDYLSSKNTQPFRPYTYRLQTNTYNAA